MTDIQKIKEFAREFVNGNGRTAERRRLISTVYFRIYGERLRAHCSTCYIEAIFKIINIMETKPCKYRLKKGAILQPFGGGIITNDNLTDEIAEQCLANHVANASMFAVMPVEPEKPAELEIVPPVDDVIPVVIDKVVNVPVEKIDTEAKPVMASKPKSVRGKKHKK